MTRPIFTCRNILQRLRETYDRSVEYTVTPIPRTIRVKYTVTYTNESGKTFEFPQERVLTDIEATTPEDLARFIERDFLESDQSEISSSERIPIAELRSGSFTVIVTDTFERQPTGDDDQM